MREILHTLCVGSSFLNFKLRVPYIYLCYQNMYRWVMYRIQCIFFKNVIHMYTWLFRVRSSIVIFFLLFSFLLPFSYLLSSSSTVFGHSGFSSAGSCSTSSLIALSFSFSFSLFCLSHASFAFNTASPIFHNFFTPSPVFASPVALDSSST